MFVGGLAFLVAAGGLIWIFFAEQNSSWIVLLFAVIFFAAASDMIAHTVNYQILSARDRKRRAEAVRFQFHALGEIPGEYSKAGYIVDSVDDLINLIAEMRDMEVTRGTLLIQSFSGGEREDGLDPRTVTVTGYGFVGTLSKPLTA